MSGTEAETETPVQLAARATVVDDLKVGVSVIVCIVVMLLASMVGALDDLLAIPNLLQGVMLIGICCFPTSAYVLIAAHANSLNVRASAKWPTARGRVLPHLGDPTGLGFTKRLIHYSYEVNGTTYQNDRLRFGAAGMLQPETYRQLTQRYPEDSAVDVFYDPVNPVVSVLDRSDIGARHGRLIGFGLLIFPFVMSLLFYIQNNSY